MLNAIVAWTSVSVCPHNTSGDDDGDGDNEVYILFNVGRVWNDVAIRFFVFCGKLLWDVLDFLRFFEKYLRKSIAIQKICYIFAMSLILLTSDTKNTNTINKQLLTIKKYLS